MTEKYNTRTDFIMTIQYSQSDGGAPGYGRIDAAFIKKVIGEKLSVSQITVTERDHSEDLSND